VISDTALDHLQRVVGEPDFAGTRYEALSVLGRGGIGTVYLARDSVLDREVAIKVLDSAVGDRAMADHLQQEARILARLEHPGIVPVHDFGRLADGRLFYAMKRVRGERLDRWAADADPHARLAVFLRICDAVAFAHAHGVIHRDLKPENVMVGEFGEVLVLDWGVAGFVVGTPSYMAPEQRRGAAAVDERADIHALGAILAGLGDDAKALAAIATKAQSPEPGDRYQSVLALSRDVSRFMSDLSVHAHAETVVDRLLRVGRRYRTPLVLVLTYLVIRLLLLWVLRI
jgi:tRNA A-37 threonylcarbamoyl transferase component Bud32